MIKNRILLYIYRAALAYMQKNCMKFCVRRTVSDKLPMQRIE